MAKKAKMLVTQKSQINKKGEVPRKAMKQPKLFGKTKKGPY